MKSKAWLTRDLSGKRMKSHGARVKCHGARVKSHGGEVGRGRASTELCACNWLLC